MTEANQVNGAIRQHLGPLGRFLRMEHAYDVGVPDWYYRLRDASGWIEAKLIPANGRLPKHFTLDQITWGEEEVAHGGRWFLLGLREPSTKHPRAWVMHDIVGARAWFEDRPAVPLVDAPGRFPVGEIVRHIAPRAPVIVSRKEIIDAAD